MSGSRALWLQLNHGVAGDMVLGALLDAGAPLEGVRDALSELGVKGWTLEAERTSRAGVAATRAVVSVHDHASSRQYREIAALLERAPLSDRVRARSQRAFRLLAEVESELHRAPIDEVHFHEVGGHDAIVDIVGVMVALELLDISEVYCSPVGLGHGVIRSAHGQLPGPAPATARLLQGFEVTGVDLDLELATPTGAALVASLCTESRPMPLMTLCGHGLGAGTRDLPGWANVVGAFIGAIDDPSHEQVALLETTIDDVTGEHLALALRALLDEGALDAWLTPVTMKKGRPGYVLSTLVRPESIAALSDVIHRTTGSLGVRSSLLGRSVLERRHVSVEVAGISVSVKVSAVRAKPELEDLVAVVTATGMTLKEAERAALDAFRSRTDL